MKTKALLLSALILAPSAGAAAAQSASTQDFRVQTGKALAAPAQDFRVSYGSTTQATTPTIFAIGFGLSLGRTVGVSETLWKVNRANPLPRGV